MELIIDENNFLPHQYKWWRLRNFIKLLVGGFGCGKTYIGAIRALYLSCVNSPHPGQYVSPTYDMMMKTIVPTLQSIALEAELDFEYNQSLKRFYIENWDGHIWLGSGDNPNSLRGPNLAWAGIDEPFIQKKEVLNFILSRIRVGEKKNRELFLTGTPEELNWGYDIAMNDGDDYDIGMVRGKTKDNVHLGPEYYEMLKSAYSSEMCEAYLNGEFVNLKQGRAYKMFDRDKHIIHKDIQGLELRGCLDFNVDYMTAEIFAHGNGWMHFVDEIRLANSNSFEMADKLEQLYPGIRVYPDVTGKQRKSSSTKSDHQIFTDLGFHVLTRGKGNPPIMDRVNSVNALLKNDLLTIEPGKCEWLVKDFERVVFRSGDIDKVSDPALSHASDAVGYGIYYLYPAVKRQAITVRR